MTNVRGSALQSPCNHGKVLYEVGRLYSRRAENKTNSNSKKTVLHIILQNEIKVTLYMLHIVCSKAQESCVLHCLAGVLIKVKFKRILCDHYPKGQKSYNYLSYFISCTKRIYGTIK